MALRSASGVPYIQYGEFNIRRNVMSLNLNEENNMEEYTPVGAKDVDNLYTGERTSVVQFNGWYDEDLIERIVNRNVIPGGTTDNNAMACGLGPNVGDSVFVASEIQRSTFGQTVESKVLNKSTLEGHLNTGLRIGKNLLPFPTRFTDPGGGSHQTSIEGAILDRGASAPVDEQMYAVMFAHGPVHLEDYGNLTIALQHRAGTNGAFADVVTHILNSEERGQLVNPFTESLLRYVRITLTFNNPPGPLGAQPNIDELVTVLWRR